MGEPKHGRMSAGAYRVFQGLPPEDRIRAILSLRSPNDGRFSSLFWEQNCKFRSLEILAPTHAIATFAFKVERFYCNASGNLHGGAQAFMFDMCTSLVVQAIARQPGSGIKSDLDSWMNGGVSRTLSVNYLRPAPEGEDVLMECEVVQMGKKLALLRGVLKRERDGAIISTCDHNKAAVESKPGWKL